MSPSSPILVLDSGLGGLTVVRALREALPGEDILYFGDTARLPYGSKTAATVTGFVQQIIAYMLPLDPKHVVFACNTATALALPAARLAFPDVPMSGVVEPGAHAAIVAAGNKQVPVIGVLATEATTRSRVYDRTIHRKRYHARVLLRSAPLLVPIIEDGRKEDDPLVKLALHQYLYPMLKSQIDVLVLGCTHYPLYRTLIQAMVGGAVPVIDSAGQCAQDVAARLRKSGMARKRLAAGEATGQGSLRCFVTDDPARFGRLSSRFLGFEIDAPQRVSTEDLHDAGANAAPLQLSVPA